MIFFFIKFHWEFLMCHHLLFKSRIKHYNIGSADFSNILMKLWYCYLKKKKKLEDILMLKYWKSGKIHWQIILHCNAVFPLKDKSNDKNNIQVELIEKGTESDCDYIKDSTLPKLNLKSSLMSKSVEVSIS